MVRTCRRRSWGRHLGGCLILLLLALGPRAALAEDLTVYAAASLKTALDAVAAQFKAEKGTNVALSYAASSALARQIERGAPADLFLSADRDWMDYLETRRLIRPETRVDFLSNRLILVGPSGLDRPVSIGPGFDLAGLLGEGRLAMADPSAVPAGKYAKAALEALGVWTSVAGRLAPAENARAALALVARGEVPAGIVYATDARAEPRVTVLGTFPETAHSPIIYPVAVTATGRDDAAMAFLAYLLSDKARPHFLRQGFTVLAPVETLSTADGPG